MKRRIVFPIALAVAGVLFACKDDALSPDMPGSIVINIVAAKPPATTGGAERAPAAQLEAQALDQVTAVVSGPMTKTQDLAFNASDNAWEGTIGDLTPGTYAVAVQGFSAGEVEYYGQTGNVLVSSGATATATISNWGDFRPSFVNLPVQTTSFTVRVQWNQVSTATEYILEWDTDQLGSFPNRLTGLTGTTADIDFPQQTGAYWVRMRSVNQVVSGGGKPSDPQLVDIVTDIPPSGDTPASAPNLGFGSGANQRMLDLSIFPENDQDWWALDACSGDSLRLEVYAQRLDPPSQLDPVVGLFQASDGTLVDSNDDIDFPDTTDSRLIVPQLPVNGSYWVLVIGFDSTEIGAYELEIDLTGGPNNQGTSCGTPDLAPTSVTAPSTGTTGEIMRVDVTVDNLGDGPARPGWTGDIRLSTDNVISTADIQLTTYSEDTQIDPGIPFTRTLAVVLPETLTPGTYYLGVIVDANGDLSELDETNNSIASVSTIDISAAAFSRGKLASLNLHTCRVDDTGAAQCWGDNLDGELGDGTLDNVRTSPVTVIGGLTFSQIVTGQFHTCGLTTTQEVYCWGWNGDGQLGDPNT
ncbi:MAG: CARDB domain-containing protein, partial [Gemmatimonadales bacterium]